MTTLTKFCSHCKTEKTTENFSKNKRSKDGLDFRCKECRAIASRDYQAKVLKTYAGLIENRWRSMNQRCVNGCYKTLNTPQFNSYVKKGIKINITKEEFVNWMLSVEEIHNQIVSRGEISSIDRIDEEKGYELGNLQLISLHENLEKRAGKTCEYTKTDKKIQKKVWNRNAYLRNKSANLTNEF